MLRDPGFHRKPLEKKEKCPIRLKTRTFLPVCPPVDVDFRLMDEVSPYTRNGEASLVFRGRNMPAMAITFTATKHSDVIGREQRNRETIWAQNLKTDK